MWAGVSRSRGKCSSPLCASDRRLTSGLLKACFICVSRSLQAMRMGLRRLIRQRWKTRDSCSRLLFFLLSFPDANRMHRNAISNMFPSAYFSVSLLKVLHCSAQVTRAVVDDGFQAALEERALPVLPNLPSLPLFNSSATDAEIMQVNTSAATPPGVFCDSQMGGVQVNADRCFNAWKYIPTGEVQETWAIENSGIHADVYLPDRIFSGKHIIRPRMALIRPSD